MELRLGLLEKTESHQHYLERHLLGVICARRMKSYDRRRTHDLLIRFHAGAAAATANFIGNLTRMTEGRGDKTLHGQFLVSE